jgi:DNA-3-methyladenine glycosylase
MSSLTPAIFYMQPTLEVARALLGKRLVRRDGGMRLSGIITETEAYIGEEDQACHARSGRTRRNEVMYGPSGFAYVYFTYGMHWMLNVVTEAEGMPAAVLLRAMLPMEGREVINLRRSGRDVGGPAKLTQALGIDARFNATCLYQTGSILRIEEGVSIAPKDLLIGPRVGLNNTPEPWKSMPWRFRISSAEKLLVGEWKR